ncbi:MAG: histidine phosphatase family protein [Rhodospirillaceae bacterium]
MEIVFVRHGNTFGPGDKVVWVGRETDLELVDKGRQQARSFGAALVRSGLVPDRVYCASLKRTRSFAELAIGQAVTDGGQAGTDGCTLPIHCQIDRRLDEVDYGAWARLTSDEISVTPEAAASLKDWSERDIFPANAGWGSGEAEILSDIQSFVADVILTAGAGERLLVISSNGILRFFPRILNVVNPELTSYVMKTGHAGMITGELGAFRVSFWNLPAEAMGLLNPCD